LDKAASWLKATLGYEFNDSGLFQQALTHRSAPGQSNERLEFLGDAVLDLVVSEIVFRAQPGADEGDLSRLRSALVKDTSLAELAAELGIGEFLVLGSGEKKSGGQRRQSILADAVEAIFGAVYLDSGLDEASVVISRAFGDRFENLPDPQDLRDPKTRLQEWLQARHLGLPVYELVEVSGKAHRQTFVARCQVPEQAIDATGKGQSRRGAEQQSARRMLNALIVREQGA
jgi:ribonuclease-3